MEPTPELDVIIGLLILGECRTDAIISILQQKGITVSSEEIDNKTQNVYQKEYAKKREKILFLLEP